MCTTNIHFTDYNFANETTNYSDLLESRSRQKMNRYKKKKTEKKHTRTTGQLLPSARNIVTFHLIRTRRGSLVKLLIA